MKPQTRPLGVIIEDMPEAEYHLRPEVSKHDMDMIRRAPLYYQYKKDNPEPETEEMNFGSLVHLALLQPHLLESSVAFLPDDMPNRVPDRSRYAKKPSPETLAACARWDEWTAENAGKQIVKHETFERVLGIQASIMANPDTAIYFEGEQLREASLFWERFGVKCRARLDILKSGEIVDLKTCGDASRQGFAKDIGKRRYAHQGEHYLDGARACGRAVSAFTMIAVETNPPFLCAAHQLGETSISIAKSENKRDLAIFKKCQESGIWPNIKNSNSPLEGPLWGFEE
jgi:exodeoxyribonuclease VIII